MWCRLEGLSHQAGVHFSVRATSSTRSSPASKIEGHAVSPELSRRVLASRRCPWSSWALLLFLLARHPLRRGQHVHGPRPEISLGAPFELVGRNAPLVLDVRDAHGLRSVRVAIPQGDDEKVVADE